MNSASMREAAAAAMRATEGEYFVRIFTTAPLGLYLYAYNRILEDDALVGPLSASIT